MGKHTVDGRDPAPAKKPWNDDYQYRILSIHSRSLEQTASLEAREVRLGTQHLVRMVIQ